MAQIDRRALWIGFGLGALALVALAAYLAWPTPQLGADQQSLAEVDALYTAVTARSEKLLSDCEKRLSALRSEGKVPEPAADRLASIITQARSGDWEAAAKRLYAFIQAQRL